MFTQHALWLAPATHVLKPSQVLVCAAWAQIPTVRTYLANCKRVVNGCVAVGLQPWPLYMHILPYGDQPVIS